MGHDPRAAIPQDQLSAVEAAAADPTVQEAAEPGFAAPAVDPWGKGMTKEEKAEAWAAWNKWKVARYAWALQQASKASEQRKAQTAAAATPATTEAGITAPSTAITADGEQSST